MYLNGQRRPCPCDSHKWNVTSVLGLILVYFLLCNLELNESMHSLKRGCFNDFEQFKIIKKLAKTVVIHTKQLDGQHSMGDVIVLW